MTPTAKIEFVGSQQTIESNAIVDTGFDGYVCVPTSVAITFGLVLVGRELIELADGTEKNELVFSGSVRLFGETHSVRILLTDSEDALIGTKLLERYRVSIEFPGGKVKLRKRSTKGGKAKDA